MAKKEVKKKSAAKTPSPKSGANKTSAKQNTRKKAGRKKNNSFRNQNLVALFLLIFGMVFLLSIMTSALGTVGVGIKSVLLGQFAGIATLASLAMIIVGAARLVYSSKFELDDIPTMLPILSFFGCTIFYGAIHLAKFQAISPSMDSIKTVFVQSIVGENIGIFPYLISYGLFTTIGRTGMFLLSISIFLFIIVFYFKMSFSKIGDASIALAAEGKKVAQGLGKKTMDYITVDDDEEQPKKRKLSMADREKLDETVIEQKYGFLERYRSEIAEFTEFGSSSEKEDTNEKNSSMSKNTENNNTENNIEHSIEENDARNLGEAIENSYRREMGEGDSNFISTADESAPRIYIHDGSHLSESSDFAKDSSENNFSKKQIPNSAEERISSRFGILLDESDKENGETKVFHNLADQIRQAEQKLSSGGADNSSGTAYDEQQRSDTPLQSDKINTAEENQLQENISQGVQTDISAQEIASAELMLNQAQSNISQLVAQHLGADSRGDAAENFDIVDKRLAHQKDQLEKENISELATSDHQKPIVLPSKKYILPTTSLLKNYKIKQKDQMQQHKDAQKLESTLQIFGIEAKVVNIAIGPTITRYELSLKAGTKVSRILNLSDDLALALAAVAPIRIEAPIPGTSLIGIELPNAETDIVSFRAMLESDVFQNSKAKLPVALGKDVSGKVIIADIAKMPHVLVAGATGSGKSVCINTLICSILYKSSPEDVKLIMIDPKMVELSVYNDIPHLLVPVVTDMKKAPYALSWAVSEMNKRYKLFAENRVRDLDGYNAIAGVEKMPRIVIVVDELADLMMVSPNEVEDSIIRLAQKARACGMHLVIATQRPSVDVITGLIKANIPTRIAFAVSSQVDSRTILDQVGAEKLIGKGDMLFSHPSVAKPQRIQGALILDDEVNAVVDFILQQGHAAPQNEDLIEEEIKIVEAAKEEEDPLLEEILDFAIQNKQISTSLIQRRFRIGYNRASRIIDRLEELGAVSESDGAKPRKVLLTSTSELLGEQE